MINDQKNNQQMLQSSDTYVSLTDMYFSKKIFMQNHFYIHKTENKLVSFHIVQK